MADRISSDHSSLTTVRATLVKSGGLDRPKIEIPDDEADRFPDDELVRVVADDTEYRARIETPLTDDGREIRGLYETPRLARNPGEGENRLGSWVADTGVEFGQSVLVDVVEEGFKYGLREPGERVFYEATESPDEGLADIAKQLDE
ncbi:hypothetical protein NGM10_07085 [Halorussus salilacus]|uniref:DUF7112 family protein n=1 Tax=Halorussus salilacus TaxID=2953750 RepID=UPI00209CC61E|nr:hypothetical protein [Halorussus salilacus]USZ69491.1 hypothetical protein NGM10_07085 [Halorussus salilacus]